MGLSILQEPFSLTEAQISFYQKNKYIKLKKVLDEPTLAYFNDVITRKVEQLNKIETPLEERDTYGKAFLQLMNLWVDDEGG